MMDTSKLIYDWNVIDYEINRNPANHPHGVWFDDETLRDGLQSPSARNPTIDEKTELLTYMEKLGIQKVDLGLPGAGPFHREHINAMLSHITENDFQIRPGAAVRTLMHDIEPLVEMQQNHGIPIQKLRLFLEQVQSVNTQKDGRWKNSSQLWKKQFHMQLRMKFQ